MGVHFYTLKTIADALLYISLAFIMINVGREFEINKKQWRSYSVDYLIAMGAAAFPWILVALYYLFFVASPEMQLWKSGDAWKETFLLSRYAAPTSAGILFTMLAAAGLRYTWVYKKVQVLAIFDDLDTIILMIPLQILMIGMRWQMFVILFVAFILILVGWRKMKSYNLPQGWRWILAYSVIMFLLIDALYRVSAYFFGGEGSIHIEILLPAFVLGMTMKGEHSPVPRPNDEKVSNGISYFFMLLVGMSMPLFIGVDFAAVSEQSNSIISGIPMLPWGVIVIHVLMVTIISNIGKLFPLFFYKDRTIGERLAVSVGMFTRGEVGAGVLFIAIGYNLGGVLLVVSVLAMCLNLLLTGFFISYVRRVAQATSKELMQVSA